MTLYANEVGRQLAPEKYRSLYQEAASERRLKQLSNRQRGQQTVQGLLWRLGGLMASLGSENKSTVRQIRDAEQSERQWSDSAAKDESDLVW